MTSSTSFFNFKVFLALVFLSAATTLVSAAPVYSVDGLSVRDGLDSTPNAIYTREPEPIKASDKVKAIFKKKPPTEYDLRQQAFSKMVQEARKQDAKNGKAIKAAVKAHAGKDFRPEVNCRANGQNPCSENEAERAKKHAHEVWLQNNNYRNLSKVDVEVLHHPHARTFTMRFHTPFDTGVIGPSTANMVRLERWDDIPDKYKKKSKA